MNKEIEDLAKMATELKVSKEEFKKFIELKRLELTQKTA